MLMGFGWGSGFYFLNGFAAIRFYFISRNLFLRSSKLLIIGFVVGRT